jgi:hypothetical protein
MTQRISISPSPPIAGSSATICYDFTDSGLTETELRVTYYPASSTTTHTVDTADNCVTVTIPASARQITVEDLKGPSPDLVRAVDQPKA